MSLERVIHSRARDLGGFTVRRTLPQIGQRRVGPFIFFDHFGPTTIDPAHDMSVRPHPHIGLATLTYLYEGAVLHRDSLGTVQRIEPGAINWMTAGRGIAHSERTPDDLKGRAYRSHGLQIWIGLPTEAETTEPAFHHHPADSLPSTTIDGVQIRQLVGTAYGLTSPVETFSPMFYTDALLPDGASLTAPEDYEERAIYVVSGSLCYGGETYQTGDMLILRSGSSVDVTASGEARIVLLGGAPLSGERLMWWNLVSSDRARLEAAKLAWKNGSFPVVPGDEEERIPLPEEPAHIELVETDSGGEFRIYRDGEILGEMTWRRVGADIMDIHHTGVREALQGQGWARRLVRRGVREARERGWTIRPSCSYARKVITTTEDLQSVLASS